MPWAKGRCSTAEPPQTTLEDLLNTTSETQGTGTQTLMNFYFIFFKYPFPQLLTWGSPYLQTLTGCPWWGALAGEQVCVESIKSHRGSGEADCSLLVFLIQQ